MSVFDTKKVNHMVEPMFCGESVAVARYDEVRYPFFEKLTEKQHSFFWRETEVSVDRDRIDFRERLDDAEQHLFLKNLQYQILLDSVQGRSPLLAFLPHCSLPELESWLIAWSFSETIHSRSYTHIIRNAMPNPSAVFDEILDIQPILDRAKSVTDSYDSLIDSKGDKEKLFLALIDVNVLEAIRFYVSFACSFSFAERGLMEGNAKIIKLIAREQHCGFVA